MTTSLFSSTATDPHEFETLVGQIRPELHRYCARMVGSVVDAEDVVQEALAKAYASLPDTPISNMRGWLFRIAHNKAIDHLRRAKQQHLEYLDEQALLAEPELQEEGKELVPVALSVFLKLAPKQRSCVILKDVMGCSIAEIAELLDATIPEIKAALHRGRERLGELSPNGKVAVAPPKNERERGLLAGYIERFNARDFDAVRAMLVDEVRLDLVNRTKLEGIVAVGEYFHRYEEKDDWRLEQGMVEGHPAIMVYDMSEQTAAPSYFVLLSWDGGRVSLIRDFRYARYVMRDIELGETGD